MGRVPRYDVGVGAIGTDATVAVDVGLASTEVAAPDPLIGVVLGGTYELTEVIAQGGMGRLYAANHLRLERQLAVKVILDRFAHLPAVLARFDREAISMSRIRSPHVVDVIDILRLPDGRPCIVTEKLEGEDLETVLQREGKLPLDRAIRIARQMCAGLAAAHDKGVVHRDVKPSNVFLVRGEGGEETTKLLDFGVAKVLEDAQLTAADAVVGTPAYLAPEQARSSTAVDARTDVYAVGAVLYRMTTGRAPYVGEEATTVLAGLLEREPTRPTTLTRDLPIELETLIQRAMARDRDARPADMRELDAALASFEASRAKTAAPAAAPSGKLALWRRPRWQRPIAIAAALPIFALVGVALASPLATLVARVNGVASLSNSERVLVAVVAGIGALITAIAYARTLAKSWRSGPAIEALVSRVNKGMLAGAATLAAIELGAHAWALIANTPSLSFGLFGALRALLALIVGALVFSASKR